MPSPQNLSPLSLDAHLYGPSGGNEADEEVPWATGRDASSRRRSSLSPLTGALKRVTPGLSIGTPHHHNNPLLATTDLGADVLPVLSPTAQSAAHPPDQPYLPGQPKSLAGIAGRAFGLGAVLASSVLAALALALATASPLWRLPFFAATLALFHFLEFLTTAACNTPAATVESFLLRANWPAYAVAHAAAALECLLTHTLWSPAARRLPPPAAALLLAAGFALVAAGQVVRSAAMAQAGRSFHHQVQARRARGQVLVTTGIYGALRHPSYFGFYWWALGTQLVMGNVVCFFAYALALWRFFSARIRYEEETLVRFFGDDYVEYRKRTGTKIPFIP